MLEFILVPLAAVRVFFRTREDTAIEILALRQQLAVLKRKRPRPRLHPLDRLFWTGLRRVWSRWAEVLVVAKPQTLVGWHRAGFRLFWRWRSRARGGRPKTTAAIPYCPTTRRCLKLLFNRKLRLTFQTVNVGDFGRSDGRLTPDVARSLVDADLLPQKQMVGRRSRSTICFVFNVYGKPPFELAWDCSRFCSYRILKVQQVSTTQIFKLLTLNSLQCDIYHRPSA